MRMDQCLLLSIFFWMGSLKDILGVARHIPLYIKKNIFIQINEICFMKNQIFNFLLLYPTQCIMWFILLYDNNKKVFNAPFYLSYNLLVLRFQNCKVFKSSILSDALVLRDLDTLSHMLRPFLTFITRFF